MKIQPGKYQHFKGNFYQVIDTVTHSETQETLVLYKPLYGEQALWVRPIEMFVEEIERDGKVFKRFTLVE
ncbi:MAG: DUF1653 domain-containing protein [Pseudoalteromonas spongiae]|uniref:DUF1653 domain-containing protein n=1 Tax=Pseudoalteromonas spongiae TaxID=298657 RepID=A0ABU8EPM6_9GAMM|nr:MULTISPECIES: DUF1653 domain-containing protein [Pseudoalteromonas]ATC97345.1 hypothetical protein PSPO_a0082 [Pseudoalteromonas spongiae UST010723-006]KPV94292.1 hypothetical protein AN214_03625 [Pseudoalteromonas sp. P1-9]MCF6458681.1 DUF1653 domain-containing protein [Pseudoalteromonas sp. MMG024]TMO88052.1 DUF1653 domain-containing protein [Pseudoalteromonas spongiae]